MSCLLLWCSNSLHVWNYLLCKLDVMISDEVDFILHSINNTLQEEGKLE